MSTEQAKLHPINTAISEFVASYEMDSGEGYYQPNEHERFLIEDAILTILDDDDFKAALQVPGAIDGVSQAASTTPSEPMAAIDAGAGYPSMTQLIADMRRDVMIAIRDHASKAPEAGVDGQPDETWESWFSAAFDMASDAVDDELQKFEAAALRAGQVAAQPSDDLDAWKCDRCNGDGWYWTEEEGCEPRDRVSSKTHCDQCDGLGWCGPDAAKASAAASPAQAPATPSPVAPVQVAQAGVQPVSDNGAVLESACDLLSLTIGTLMSHRAKIGYVDNSPIAALVRDAVEFLLPWPEKMPVLPASQAHGKSEAVADEVVQKALRRAYQLGQAYWQQADSEYTSQHRKSDETRAKFEALCVETIAECSHQSMALTKALQRHESDIAQLIKDRDSAQKHADRLAGAIAEYFEVDIGEHSNMNCPWSEAFDAVTDRALSAPPIESKGVREVADAQLMVARFEDMVRRHAGGDRSDSALRGAKQDLIAALVDAPAAPITAVPAGEGWKLVPMNVTEEMHVAAVKVLHRANGLDGLPQRMLDAMLSAAGVPGVVHSPADAVRGPITEAPERGARVWYFDALGRVGNHKWTGGPLDLLRLRDRRIFAAEADALAALAVSRPIQPASDAGEQA